MQHANGPQSCLVHANRLRNGGSPAAVVAQSIRRATSDERNGENAPVRGGRTVPFREWSSELARPYQLARKGYNCKGLH